MIGMNLGMFGGLAAVAKESADCEEVEARIAVSLNLFVSDLRRMGLRDAIRMRVQRGPSALDCWHEAQDVANRDGIGGLARWIAEVAQ